MAVEKFDYWEDVVEWGVSDSKNLYCKIRKVDLKDSKKLDNFASTAVVFLLIISTIGLFFVTGASIKCTPNSSLTFFLSSLTLSIIASVFVSFITEKKVNEALSNKEIYHGMMHYTEEKIMTKRMPIENVTQEQAIEIKKELKHFKKTNNKNEYMKIVNSLLEGERRINERRKLENQERALSEKKKKVEKVKANPYLNGEYYENNLKDYISKFEKNNKNILNEDFVNELNEITKTIDLLYKSNKSNIAVKNCRDELLEVTNKYNKLASEGGVLNSIELLHYEELVKTCRKIIDLNSVKELTGELSNSAQVSTIYLKDKFGV